MSKLSLKIIDDKCTALSIKYDKLENENKILKEILIEGLLKNIDNLDCSHKNNDYIDMSIILFCNHIFVKNQEYKMIYNIELLDDMQKRYKISNLKFRCALKHTKLDSDNLMNIKHIRMTFENIIEFQSPQIILLDNNNNIIGYGNLPNIIRGDRIAKSKKKSKMEELEERIDELEKEVDLIRHVNGYTTKHSHKCNQQWIKYCSGIIFDNDTNWRVKLKLLKLYMAILLIIYMTILSTEFMELVKKLILLNNDYQQKYRQSSIYERANLVYTNKLNDFLIVLNTKVSNCSFNNNIYNQLIRYINGGILENFNCEIINTYDQKDKLIIQEEIDRINNSL